MFFRNYKATSMAVGFFLILALGIQGITPAQASTDNLQAGTVYRVTTAGALTGPCGADWQNPCDLQYALSVATNGAEVWVASGTYYPDQGYGQTDNSRDSTFRLPNGVSVYGGFAGAETQWSQRNPTVNVTILSGEFGSALVTDNAYHVVTVESVFLPTRLDGVTVRGGYVETGNDFGGGIYISDTGNNVVLTDLVLTTNFAGNGGGLASVISNPKLTRVVIKDNIARQYGGGFYNQDGSPVLKDVVFDNNETEQTASPGGGMHSTNSDSAIYTVEPSLTNVTFSNNRALLGGGGGLFNNQSHAILTNVTFTNNSAFVRGGAILNEGSNVVFNNVTFSDNTAPAGTGGAMRNIYSNGVVPSNPIIRNTILWGNGSEEIVTDPGNTVTIYNSVVQGGCPSLGTCTDIATGDPKLGPLANNGGFTQTMALGFGSSALNTGNNATCATTDQRDFARPWPLVCDMGAYEAYPLTVTADPKTITYGDPEPTYTLQYSGFAGGDTVSVINTPPTCTVPGPYPNAGTHPIVCSGGADDKYTFFYVDGTLTVHKATPTISVANSPVPYNGSGQSAQVTGSVPGTASNILTGGAASQTNVGIYAVTADFVPTDTTNYNSLSNASAGNFTIIKATPTLSVTNSPITYDGAPHVASVSHSVPGTVSNILIGGAPSRINAGTYAVTANFVPTDTANYNSLTNASAGSFTINKATPTLSITNSPVTYDGAPHAASVSGSVPGAVSNILTGGAASQTNAGTHAVTASFIPTDTTNYNSLADAPVGNFVINKATPTISVSNSPVIYNGSGQTATVTGSVPGTASNILVGGAASQTNVGTYVVTASFVPTDTANYNNLTNAPAGNFTINKATPTISVSNSPVIYNGSSQTAIVTGSVPGTASNILVSGAASQTNAGTYVVTASFVPSDTANYNNLTNAPAGNFTIDKATPVLSVNNSPVTYNSFPLSATLSSPVPGSFSNILIGGSASQTNAGTYAVTANFAPIDTANYHVLTNASAGTFVIEKATPILSVTNSPVLFDNQPHSPTVVSPVPGTISNILVGGSATKTAVGTYPVTANFVPTDSVNFISLTNAPVGNFVISPDITPPDTQLNIRPVTPSGADVTFTFSSTDGTATFECQLDGGGFSACSSPKNYTGLTNGSHTFDVRAKDPADNVDPTPSSYTWVVVINASSLMSSAIVTPSSMVHQDGSTSGSADSLALFEQSGTDNNAGAYFVFQTPGMSYVGQHSFYIPDDIQTTLISNALLQVNFNRSETPAQTWTWSVYDWSSNLWIKVGNTVGSTANEWNSFTFPLRTIQRFISPGREIRIQLQSNNADNDIKVDYEAIHLTYRSVTVKPTLPAPSTPANRPGIALQRMFR